MKRFFLSLIVLMINLSVFAATLNEQQTKLRSDIVTFLREEGFMPELDSDGDILFKREGSTWYITIHASDINPMFLNMVHQFGYGETYTKEVVTAALPDLNAYKGIKVYAKKQSFSFGVELYLVNADAFRYAFYKYISQITSAEEELKNFVSTPTVSISSASIGNVDEDGNVISDYGAIIYAYRTKYLKPKVTAQVSTPGSYTFYTKFYNADGVLSTSNSSPTGYSYSNKVQLGSGSQEFLLSGWGSSNAGHWKAGKYRVEIYMNNQLLFEKIFTIY